MYLYHLCLRDCSNSEAALVRLAAAPSTITVFGKSKQRPYSTRGSKHISPNSLLPLRVVFATQTTEAKDSEALLSPTCLPLHPVFTLYIAVWHMAPLSSSHSVQACKESSDSTSPSCVGRPTVVHVVNNDGWNIGSNSKGRPCIAITGPRTVRATTCGRWSVKRQRESTIIRMRPCRSAGFKLGYASSRLLTFHDSRKDEHSLMARQCSLSRLPHSVDCCRRH
jgi:hypothetical protein